jgi:lipopolysaccharide exporter
VLFAVVLRRRIRFFVGHFRFQRIVRLALRYRRFPLFSTPAAILNALARLPLLLLPLFFGAAVLGLFGLAVGALSIPLSLIGGAVGQVFFLHATEAHRAQRLAEATAAVHARLVMIGAFPALALIVAGPELFEVVFGGAWREAGSYARYLAVWIFLGSVASPLTRLFDVLERQKADLVTSAAMFLAHTLALVAGGMTGNVTTTMILLGTAGALARITHLTVLLHLGRVMPDVALRPYVRYGLYSAAALTIPAATLPIGSSWVTTATVVAAAIFYGLVLVRQERLSEWSER